MENPATSDGEGDILMETIEKPIRGVAKSGRIWKTVRNERHSAIIRDKPLHTKWQKKQENRTKYKAMKLMEKEMKETRKRENEEKKRIKKERAERRLENQKKAEIVQVIKNVHKLKRIKKKQLKSIEKRDTN